MAVAIEFVNVIIRKSAVEAKYPGGLDGFVRQDLPNYLEDEYVARVGFMSSCDAFRFVEELAAVGLRYGDEGDFDVAVIWGDHTVPSWLNVGSCDGRPASWLNGYPPGKLIDLDPAMLLRCRAFGAVAEIARVLSRTGAEIGEVVVDPERSDSVVLECARGLARIEVEIFQDPNSGQPIGIWGRRRLARRTLISVDVELLRDLKFALVNAGAEDP